MPQGQLFKVTPDIRAYMIKTWAAGGTKSLLAKALGVHRETLDDILKRNPDLMPEMEAAKAARVLEVLEEVQVGAPKDKWEWLKRTLREDAVDFIDPERKEAASGTDRPPKLMPVIFPDNNQNNNQEQT